MIYIFCFFCGIYQHSINAAAVECGEVKIPNLVPWTLQFTKPLHVLQKAVKFKVLSSDLKTMGYNLFIVQHHFYHISRPLLCLAK